MIKFYSISLNGYSRNFNLNTVIIYSRFFFFSISVRWCKPSCIPISIILILIVLVVVLSLLDQKWEDERKDAQLLKQKHWIQCQQSCKYVALYDIKMQYCFNTVFQFTLMCTNYKYIRKVYIRVFMTILYP